MIAARLCSALQIRGQLAPMLCYCMYLHLRSYVSRLLTVGSQNAQGAMACLGVKKYMCSSKISFRQVMASLLIGAGEAGLRNKPEALSGLV